MCACRCRALGTVWLAGSLDHSKTNENVLPFQMIHPGISPSSYFHCCFRFLKTRKQDCNLREGEVVIATSCAQQQLEQLMVTGIKQIWLNRRRLNQRRSRLLRVHCSTRICPLSSHWRFQFISEAVRLNCDNLHAGVNRIVVHKNVK